MDVQEFRLLLEAFGPDLAAWPEPVADAAVTLMAGSDAAQDLLAAASTAKPAPEGAPPAAVAELVEKILKATRSPG